MAKETDTKKEEKLAELQVVETLPTASYRQEKREDKDIIYMTRDEVLAEILITLREIKKNL